MEKIKEKAMAMAFDNAFKHHDKDKNGSLHKEELAHVFEDAFHKMGYSKEFGNMETGLAMKLLDHESSAVVTKEQAKNACLEVYRKRKGKELVA